MNASILDSENNRVFPKIDLLFYLTINDPLPVLSDNEQDVGHENIVNNVLSSVQRV